MIDNNLILKTASEARSITDYVDLNKRKYNKNLSFSGVYIFWFKNSDSIAHSLNRELEIDGPDRKTQKIIWNWNLSSDLICLYVGKSTNIQKRLGQHLLLRTKNLYISPTKRLNKKTTSCQLRSGFDYLYQNSEIKDMFNEISKRLHYSVIREDDFIKRFYMEDLLVGNLYPWFNVDSER